MGRPMTGPGRTEMSFEVPGARLDGTLTVPPRARGLVVFVHGSGSGRHSPRNRAVARRLNDEGLATLLFDLMTFEEEAQEHAGATRRFDIDMLAARLVCVLEALRTFPASAGLQIGLFGSSTGGGAALVAAAERPDMVAAVVSRGGRPDLARQALSKVRCPVLLMVGGRDGAVLEMNEDALSRMRCDAALQVVQGATHLFGEPGALQVVAQDAAAWFLRWLSAPATAAT